MSALEETRLLAVIDAQNEITASGLQLDAVMHLVAERARVLTRAAGSLVAVSEADDLVCRIGTGTSERLVGSRLRLAATALGMEALAGATVECADAAADPRIDADTARQIGALSVIVAPLCEGTRATGLLAVHAPRRRAFDPSDRATIALLSTVIASHLAGAGDGDAPRATRQDGITGLPNRVAFDEELEAEMEAARGNGRPLSLCLVDVVHLAQLNDEYGHAAGDAVLAAVADVLRGGRAADRAYRLGGGEFAVILPETSIAGGLVLAHRLEKLIAARPLAGVPVRVRAACAESAGPSERLYRLADAALYRRRLDERERRGGRGADAAGRHAEIDIFPA